MERERQSPGYQRSERPFAGGSGRVPVARGPSRGDAERVAQGRHDIGLGVAPGSATMSRQPVEFGSIAALTLS